MKLKIAAALAATLSLAACGPTPSERARAKATLPADCQIFELGHYGQISQMVVVRCENSTTTTNGAIPVPKQPARLFSTTTLG